MAARLLYSEEMKRLLPVVVLAVTAAASCTLNLAGQLDTGAGGAGSATTSSLAGPSGGVTTASSGGAGGDPATTSATATASTSSASSSTGGVLTGWLRRRKLDLDSGQNTQLDGFTILVRLDTSRIDYAQTHTNGQDLRFLDDQGGALFHEIELWDENGISLIWVRVPSVKVRNGSDGSSLYMYYGNEAAKDSENAKGVWSDGYHGVWHLSEGGDSFVDSSGKSPKAAKNYSSTQLGSSILGKGRSFEASNKQYIDTFNKDNLAKFTIEAWVRSSNSPATDQGVNGPLLREQNYQFTWDHDTPGFAGAVVFKASPPTNDWVASPFTSLNANTWYYLAATYDGTKLRSYNNGLKKGEVDAKPPLAESLTAKIGRHEPDVGAKGYFNGDVDEVRISQTSHTDEWIAAQYKSMMDSGFVTFGPEETLGAGQQP